MFLLLFLSLFLLLTIIAATLEFGFATQRLNEFVDDGHDAYAFQKIMTKEGYRGNRKGVNWGFCSLVYSVVVVLASS